MPATQLPTPNIQYLLLSLTFRYVASTPSCWLSSRPLLCLGLGSHHVGHATRSAYAY